ncbi:hypothetical protein ASG87_10515 [Frateuria sp. Soil773]|nr:hypothetical protein ASG87_10515 [Frateuria sp. Soil773]
MGGIALALAGCHREASKPAPAPAPAAPVVEQAHQTLSADALFAFGKATLKTGDANSELDGLAEKLKQASRIESVQLLGYTDRIGGDKANERLSLKRAEAVRDYLVGHGVPADAIKVEGRGAADPVADCPDLKGRKLIACLAPNRRVEVNISTID